MEEESDKLELGGNKMNDIRYYDTFTKIYPIHKGWSGDKKFYIETKNSERLLLRISDISKYEEKKYEFALIKKYLLSE